MSETEALPRVEIVPYDTRWPSAYAAERADIISICGPAIVELEQIGSTSVPGLSAKPIIDMMAAVTDFEIGHVLEHFSIRLGVARVCEISFAFFFGNHFEKRRDCSPKLLNSARLHFA